MKISAIKTQKIIPGQVNLFDILDSYLKSFSEQSILAVTSKIVAICEKRVVETEKIDKKKLMEQEAEYFLPPEKNKYNITLTIKNNILIPSAGVDESNGASFFILWPKNPQKTANKIRRYLCERFSIQKAGVIITDSKTSPLRRGVTGVAIAHSGFVGLNNYIGKSDIFGKKMRITRANILDALASSAVLVMGEGKEQTPIAIIKNIPFVEFQSRNPTKKELQDFYLSLKEDLYAGLLKNVKWKKGKGGFSPQKRSKNKK